MTEKSVVIELNLQDCFFSNEDLLDEREAGRNCGRDPVFQTAPLNEDTWSQWFQSWLTYLQPDLSDSGYEVTLRLTDDQEMQSLNGQYRHKDQPTDVLAFAALESDFPQTEAMLAQMPLYLGDIVVSVETAQRQAQERGHGLTEELVWLSAHGLLHLLGWDHPDEESLTRMVHQQEDLLQMIGLSVQYD
jgi:probable rRNA maturation factor